MLNHSELVQSVHGVEYLAPQSLRLEPEWGVVVLATLIYSGDLVLAMPGKQFDATGLPQLAATPVRELAQFKHVEQPKDWNVPALKALFELLELTPGLAQEVTQGKDGPVQQLRQEAAKTVEKLVLAQRLVQTGLPFWDRRLLPEDEAQKLLSRLDQTKSFLESLQAYSTPGRLKNLRYDVQEIRQHRAGLHALRDIEALQELVTNSESHCRLSFHCRSCSTVGHAWIESMKTARSEVLIQIDDPGKRTAATFRQQTLRRLADLKKAMCWRI